MTNHQLEFGGCICSTVEAGDGTYKARVEIKGRQLNPTHRNPELYLSEERFNSEAEALDHGIAYVNRRFPERDEAL